MSGKIKYNKKAQMDYLMLVLIVTVVVMVVFIVMSSIIKNVFVP